MTQLYKYLSCLLITQCRTHNNYFAKYNVKDNYKSQGDIFFIIILSLQEI